MKASVYEIVTSRIMDKLNEGVIPWLKPWNARTSSPRNLVTGKPYRGINVFVLGMQAYQSPYWLTFKQATDRGGKIKKGEKGTPVVYWNFIDVEDKATGEAKKTPFLRYYTVFNVAQTEGIEAPTDTPADEFNPIEEAARIVGGYKEAPKSSTGSLRPVMCQALMKSACHRLKCLFLQVIITMSSFTRWATPPDMRKDFPAVNQTKAAFSAMKSIAVKSWLPK